MSDSGGFKRYPAVRCWIKHLLEGNYSDEDKALYTIFGLVKRVRLLATIVDKREIIENSSDEDDDLLDLEDEVASRIEFDLDDGTGLIRATLWQVRPDKYDYLQKGDLIDVVGKVRQYKEFTSISPEILRKIHNPNYALLRNAQVVKKIKKGELEEIPSISEDESEIDEMEVEEFFENEIEENEDVKEKIYSIIEEHSINGNGINITDLLSKIDIGEEELKGYIEELEMESMVYRSEGDTYQTY
ncbi:MAG: OB-fold nucleic acid binding domain-containing protein [Promethearchaeia archaeon]